MKNLIHLKGSNKLGLAGLKCISFIVLFLTFKTANTQTLFREIFELELNSPQELDYSASVLASSDLFTVGNTWNSDAEKTNIVTTKTNGSGGVVWQTEYNGSQSKFDYGAAIALDGSGNIYVAGATNTSSATTFDVVVIKYNSSGTQQWATTYNGTGSDNDIPSAILINGSDIYVGAASIGSGTGYDFVTMKLTTSGTITWSSRYDYNSLYDLPGYLAMQSSNIVVTGGSQSTTTNWDYTAVKYNSSGTQVDEIRSSASGYGFDRPTGLVKDASDKFYITGHAYNGYDYDMRTIKLDDDLSPIWTVTEDEGDEDGGNSICIDGSANTYIAGFATNGSGKKEMKIVKYNSSGTQQWEQILSNGRSDIDAEATYILYNSTNSRVVITGFYKYPSGESKITTLALSASNGSVIWQNTYPSLDLTIDRPTRLHESGNNIWIYGTRTVGAATQYITIKYEILEREKAVTTALSGLQYRENEVIIKFDPDEVDLEFVNNRQSQFADLEDIISEEIFEELEPILLGEGQFTPVAVKVFKRLTAENTETLTRLGKTIEIPSFWSTFVITTNIDPIDILDELAAVDGVEYVELNQMLYGDLFPDDFDVDQEGLFNGNLAIDDVNMDRAWDVETGGTHVRVGVVDYGIYWPHEDFNEEGFATFGSSKIEGGWDYGNNYEIWNDENDDENAERHGTCVAGIIGAISNNTLGIAGVAGGSQEEEDLNSTGVQLFDFQITDKNDFDKLDIESASEAVVEAASYTPDGSYGFGIQILNYSFGGYDLDLDAKLLQTSVEFAFKNNVIQVGSKGNDGIEVYRYPGDFRDDHILSVGGSGADGEWDEDANFGGNIDLIAPFGIDPINMTLTNTGIDDYVVDFDGTSASVPIVSGTAALMLSEVNNHDGEPHFENLTHEDVENILQNTASDRDVEEYDDNTGWGILDAQASLEAVELPHFQVRHFCRTYDDEDFDLDDEDVVVTILDGGLAVPPGIYYADRYILDVTLTHTLPASSEIIGWWSLPSMTNTYTLENPINFRDFLMGTPSLSSVDGVAYIYYITQYYPTGSFINKWIPFDPFVTDAELCYTLHIFDDEATAINEINGELINAKVYPNPTISDITIETKFDQSGEYTIEVSNLSGQIVLRKENVVISAGKNIAILNTEPFPPGLYTITLIGAEIKTSFKIVKQ